MNLFALNLVLAVVWATITGTFTPVNMLAGFVIGSFAIGVLRLQYETKYFLRGWYIVKLVWLFLYELVLSAFRVAADVLRPRMSFKPGIIALPLTTDDDVQITVLANLITLTPGTLSVDVSTDKTTLYVHAMRADDPDGLIQDLREGFERQIKETLG